MSAQQQAEDLLINYFKLALTAAGVDWDHDYAHEIRDAVGQILAAAAEDDDKRGQARDRELREEIDDLKARVHTVQAVLARYLAEAGQPVSAKSVAEAGGGVDV